MKGREEKIKYSIQQAKIKMDLKHGFKQFSYIISCKYRIIKILKMQITKIIMMITNNRIIIMKWIKMILRIMTS